MTKLCQLVLHRLTLQYSKASSKWVSNRYGVGCCHTVPLPLGREGDRGDTPPPRTATQLTPVITGVGNTRFGDDDDKKNVKS